MRSPRFLVEASADADLSRAAELVQATRAGPWTDRGLTCDDAVMSGDTIHEPISGQHVTFLETRADNGGERLRVEVRLAPGGWVPRHAHLRVRERVEILEGVLDVRLGRRTLRLAAGDSLDVPRAKLHRMANRGDGDARLVMEVRPARHMERLMRWMFGGGRAIARVLGRGGEVGGDGASR